jgi:hypothetical protein
VQSQRIPENVSFEEVSGRFSDFVENFQCFFSSNFLDLKKICRIFGKVSQFFIYFLALNEIFQIFTKVSSRFPNFRKNATSNFPEYLKISRFQSS